MQSHWSVQWAVCNCVKVSSMSVHKNVGEWDLCYFFNSLYDRIFIYNMNVDVNIVFQY